MRLLGCSYELTIAISGLSRVLIELFHLLIIPSLAPHPIQTNRVASGPWRPWRSSVVAAWVGGEILAAPFPGMLRAVAWAASTSKKRNIELPCLVMCPSRRGTSRWSPPAGAPVPDSSRSACHTETVRLGR